MIVAAITNYSCHDHLTICIATMNSIFSDGVHMAQTVIYSTQLLNCSSSLENSLNKQGNVKKILLFWYRVSKKKPGSRTRNQLAKLDAAKAT